MKCFSLWFLILSTPLLANNLLHTPLDGLSTEEHTVFGYVNWEDNTIVVYGEGVAPDDLTHPVQKRLMGFRAAKVVAYRNFLELIEQVQVTASTRIENYTTSNDSIKVQLKGIVQGAVVKPNSHQEFADGTYRIALTVPLVGQLSHEILRLVLQDYLSPLDLVPKSMPAITEDSLIAAETAMPIYISPKPHTGLLVDARGLNLQPCLAPRILSRDGRVVYSASSSEPNYTSEYGIVSYQTDLEIAIQSERLGGISSNPFIVKGQKTAGSFGGDIILDDFDATRVLMADIDGDFLETCRVVFLVGPDPVVIDEAFIDSLYDYRPPPDSLIIQDAPIEFSEEIQDSTTAE